MAYFTNNTLDFLRNRSKDENDIIVDERWADFIIFKTEHNISMAENIKIYRNSNPRLGFILN